MMKITRSSPPEWDLKDTPCMVSLPADGTPLTGKFSAEFDDLVPFRGFSEVLKAMGDVGLEEPVVRAECGTLAKLVLQAASGPCPAVPDFVGLPMLVMKDMPDNVVDFVRRDGQRQRFMICP